MAAAKAACQPSSTRTQHNLAAFRLFNRQLKATGVSDTAAMKGEIERTPTQPLANAYAPLRVSTPEATAFDLITYPS